MVKHSGKKGVLLVDLGASMGGVEAYLEALAKILAEDMDVYVLCVMRELEERLEQCGVEVIRIPKFSRVRVFRFAMATLTMMYLVIRHRIEIVQINGFLESVLLVPIRLLLRDAFYTRHGPFELDLFPWYSNPFKYIPPLPAALSARPRGRNTELDKHPAISQNLSRARTADCAHRLHRPPGEIQGSATAD